MFWTRLCRPDYSWEVQGGRRRCCWWLRRAVAAVVVNTAGGGGRVAPWVTVDSTYHLVIAGHCGVCECDRVLLGNATIDDLRVITRNLLETGLSGLASAFKDAAQNVEQTIMGFLREE
ncbi:hypothetical protein SCLCIDRAFT_1058191 [Scleroderma citrinum Foug A]|uniref:Uncharacterized protein n=1 Tax=Scleroderma citrinum Foug A TaxID=1036808 RepID=A0A0C3DRH1_9AGAM|nr:hypothetical protein SCLCIDRAFT_1058191 [Scleroderma citrinum Foug A]